MRKAVKSIVSLFTGAALLLLGHGLLGTVLSLRTSIENYSGTVTGLIMAAYFAGYIVGTFKGPGLINRIGHIRVFAICATLASAIVILHGLIVDPWFWAAARFVYGICIVMFYIVIESWLNDRAGNEQRGQLFALYTLITLAALAGGQQLLLLGEAAQLELFAIAAILLSISLIPVAHTRLPEPNKVNAPAISLKKVLANSPVGFAGCLVSGIVGGAFWSMSPLFALSSGLSETEVAAFMSIPIVGGALFQIPMGIVSDRYDRRISIVILSLLGALFAVAAIFIETLPYSLTLIAVFIFGGAFFCIYPLSVAHSNDRADPSEFLTIGSTLLLVFGFGAMVSPVITGLLIQLVGVSSMPLIYVVSLIALALFCLKEIQRKDSVPQEEKSDFAPMVRTSSVAVEVAAEEASPDEPAVQGEGFHTSDPKALAEHSKSA